MAWRLRIEHTTRVTYSGPVLTSFNEARMTPLTLPTQTTLDARVTAGPDAPVWTYNDYWGTYVSVFDLPEPHGDLLIQATATVETEPFPGIPAAPERPEWAALHEQAPHGRLLECLLPTPLTTVTAEIKNAAMTEISGLSPDEAAATISARVRDHVTYMPGATGVRTNAQEAWDKGQGVCQDMAQLAVALLRAAGLPARYVSGYLHPDVAAEPGRTSVGQSHAWVEYWAGSWVPLDPTSGAQVGERHVVVARGRDYSDVPPLKGIYHGPPESEMEVTVEVTRLALSGTYAADSLRSILRSKYLTSKQLPGILGAVSSEEACAPADPASWDWPHDVERFPEDAPLQALLLTATKLMGAYGQCTVQAAGLKVSLAGLGVLRVLLDEDGLKSSEVADRAWSSPGTVTAVVNTLVRDGFVERKPDEADRRIVRLSITDQGRAVITYYVTQAAPRWRKAFDFADEADEAVVRRFFAAMIGHLGRLMREERGR
jgi:transglutaminase-like putative cysteine protease/DNA-binding MarR family transcriptional regulator